MIGNMDQYGEIPQTSSTRPALGQGTMSNSVVATSYIVADEYEDWSDHADDLGMSISEYIQSMVRAGRKKFSVEVTPDESNQELRESRDYYRKELERERNKNSRLERQLHGGEPAAIESYVQSNPGASYDEILNHIRSTASERVSSHLESMSGNDLRKTSDGFHPAERTEVE